MALAYDAAQAKQLRQRVEELEDILGAVAASGPVEFHEDSLQNKLRTVLHYDYGTRIFTLRRE